MTYAVAVESEAAELAELIGEVWQAAGVERAAAVLLCVAMARPGVAEVTETVAELGRRLAVMRGEQLRRVAGFVEEFQGATARS